MTNSKPHESLSLEALLASGMSEEDATKLMTEMDDLNKAQEANNGRAAVMEVSTTKLNHETGEEYTQEFSEEDLGDLHKTNYDLTLEQKIDALKEAHSMFKLARGTFGWSQKYLAKLVKISQGRVSRIESGEEEVSKSLLARFRDDLSRYLRRNKRKYYRDKRSTTAPGHNLHP